MSVVDKTVNEKRHRIMVKLFPNNLPSVEGTYLTKTDNESSLTIEDVCAAIKNRNGYNGDYDTLVDCVRKYYDEVVYQLCDGNAVNNGYYSLHPNISGALDSVNENNDIKKDPINFKFHIRSALRGLVQHIEGVIGSLEESNAFIGDFIDMYEKSKNTLFIPGDIFSIYGNKIKITEDSPDCGVFFVPLEAPSKAVKVKRIVENFPSKIIGEAPDTKYHLNRIEIRTKFSGSIATTLKKPRIIISKFVLESA